MLGDLLTVNTYDNSERTFIVLDDLVDRQHLRHPERTFNVLGVMLTVSTYDTPSAPSSYSATC